MDFVKRTVNHTAEKLISDNARCRKKCYVNFANRSKVERTRKRLRNSIESGESSVIKRKTGRPSARGITVTNEEVLTWSKAITYDKTLRVICHKTGGKLHLAHTKEKETGKSMLSVSEKFSYKGFFRRLNSISSAADIANDIIYHNLGRC